MAAGSEIRSYSSNLDRTHRNIGEVRGVIEDIDDKIDKMQMAIKAVDAVEDKADEFSKTIDHQKLILKLMEKAGSLKIFAKIAIRVLDSVQNVTEKVRDKAHDLAKKIDDLKIEEKLESAEEKLEKFDKNLFGAQFEVQGQKESVDNVIYSLDKADEFDLAGDPAAVAAEGADVLVEPPNVAVDAVNDLYDQVKSAAQAVEDAIPEASYLPALALRLVFDGISDALAFLRKPLNALGKLLKPIEGVLDAVGVVFDNTVGPVIEYAMETLGIDDVIDAFAAKVNRFLPNPGILDNLTQDMDIAFQELLPLGDLEDYLGVDAWLAEINTKILDPVGDPQQGLIGIGSNDDDSLLGGSVDNLLDAAAGNDVIEGLAGNDLITAGLGNDVLDGGAGLDQAIFSGSFTEYSFSQSTQNGTIVFHHNAPANPRLVDGIDETIDIETYAFADFSLSHDELLNSVISASPGQTVLDGTDERDFLFASSNALAINALAGDDIVVGGPATDQLSGGDGDDTFIHSDGDDFYQGGAGSDTWRYPVDNASGNPDIDVDLERGTIRISRITAQLDSVENITVEDDRTVYLLGDAANNHFTASASRDLLMGRAGNDVLDGGAANDVVIGNQGADIVFGNAGNDVLVSGSLAESGVSDFYDGGDGDFDALTYAGDIREFVNKEHFSDFIENKVRTQEASGPLRVFAETGLIERLDSEGNTLISTDTAVNVEQYYGSDFDDVLYGGSGTYSVINGGDGNDTLFGENAGREVNGGSGDDIIHAGLGGANYEGGGGFDSLYLNATPGIRWLVRITGAIGSELSAFDALEGEKLALPDDNSYKPPLASRLSRGNVDNFDVYYGGDEADYFDLGDNGEITVYGAGGNDFLRGNNDGDGSVIFKLFGESGDDVLALEDAGMADGGVDNDLIEIDAGGRSVEALGNVGDDRILLRSGKVTIDGGDGYDVLVAHHRSIFTGFKVFLNQGTIESNGDRSFFSGSVNNIEEVIGADEHADLIVGDELGNRLIGAGGNDNLQGGGGRDALYGGAGNDSLSGDADDDLLHGGSGNDNLNGGSGIDTASWAFAAPGADFAALEMSSLGNLDVDLLNNTARLSLFSGGTETDSISEIENIIGGAGDDQIRGNNEDNLLSGGAGGDLLDGREGNDVLILEDDDEAIGGLGDDRFVIGAGNVVIDGGDGVDALDFGTLQGKVVIDIEQGLYSATFEVDQPVWADDGGSTPRDLNGVSLTPLDVMRSAPAFAQTAEDFARVIPTDRADLNIRYTPVLQTASGQFSHIEEFIAGASVLTGSGANDVFAGDSGNNTFQGEEGDDVIDGQSGIDTSVFNHPVADYSLQRSADGFVVEGREGRDTLHNIERLKFSDSAIAYDLDQQAGEVAKLIGAVFGAEQVSNKQFVGIGLQLMDDGFSYHELADLAISAAGANTPESLVSLLWHNVVGGTPSAAQMQPFIDVLNQDLSFADLAVLAAETELNAVNIDLIGLQTTGIEFI